MFENRKWVIVNTSDITDEMLANSMELELENVRKSLDSSQAILKWEGDTPSCFNSMTIYNYSEINIELSKSNWTEEIE